MNFRIGFGYDVHRLLEDKPFFLGGVKISHYKGAVGHSDADVLIHAICDAILGALSLGDIGQHFPDKDKKYAGIESSLLLKEVINLAKKEGYRIGNIDSTVALQEPKISAYIPQIRSTLAGILNTEAGNISVKATTEERLGFTGREEGVAAYAVALLVTG